ncbi:hypothetical protein WDU94_010760 [Cyamophila willieti]
MKNWTVHEGAVTSDITYHFITYDVCGWEQEVRNEARYNTKDVCWVAFRTELSRRLSLIPIARRADPREDIDARVAGLTQAYRGTCEFMLKKSRGVRYRGTVWWNRRLESEKIEMNRVRKKLQRAREVLQRKWRDMRDRYGESVERARRKSWERQTQIVPAIRHLFPEEQDGAPAHYSAIVRDYLDITFPNRWIGRGAGGVLVIMWPPRSPISPL